MALSKTVKNNRPDKGARKRNRVLFCLFLFCIFPQILAGQDNKRPPFKGIFENFENRAVIHLDLYNATLTAPGLDFLGKLNGYMNGRGIYGIWLLTDYKIEGKVATLRFSNDTGADSQTILFTQENDSIFQYKAINGNSIKRASGKKLVKIASEMTFKKAQ